MSGNVGWAPFGYRTVHRQCHYTLNDPTKHCTGQMKFKYYLNFTGHSTMYKKNIMRLGAIKSYDFLVK